MGEFENFKAALSALAEMYVSVHVIDLQKNLGYPIKTRDYIEQSASVATCAQKKLFATMRAITAEESLIAIMEFTDLSTLPRRLRAKKSVSVIFHSKKSGWNRANFIRMDEEAPPHYVIFAVESINEEKRLMLEMEHQLVLLNGLSREYGTVWYINAAERTLHLVTNNRTTKTTTEIVRAATRDIYYDSAIQSYIDRFVVPKDRERVSREASLDYLLTHVREGEVYHIRFSRLPLANDGEHIQASYARIRDAAGETYFVCAFREIDPIIREEQKKQQELDTARKSAEAANMAKSTFLFNMSHDIRTPLNAIIGFTELAEQHENNPELLKDFRKKTLTASHQLLDILNNVLEMARIENNKLIIDEELTDMQEFNKNWSTMFEGELTKKNLTLRKHFDLHHPYLYLDKTHITEVFMNILSNAIKYTPAGGSIYVTIVEKPNAEPGTCILETIVRDTGIGMSEEFLAQIFDRFARERSSSSSGIQGTGLGMAIVKRLIELMGGTISIKSRLGYGTTVTIRLPHHIGTAPRQKKLSVPFMTSDALAGKNILVAEDIEVNAEIVTMLLKEAGCTVDWAQDGIICVNKLESAPPGTYSLVLMDVQMPNMDGYKAAQYIRKLPEPKIANIPIIAMTANAFKEDVDRALASGMNGHLAKPIDIEKMLETLSLALKENQA